MNHFKYLQDCWNSWGSCKCYLNNLSFTTFLLFYLKSHRPFYLCIKRRRIHTPCDKAMKARPPAPLAKTCQCSLRFKSIVKWRWAAVKPACIFNKCCATPGVARLIAMILWANGDIKPTRRLPPTFNLQLEVSLSTRKAFTICTITRFNESISIDAALIDKKISNSTYLLIQMLPISKSTLFRSITQYQLGLITDNSFISHVNR